VCPKTALVELTPLRTILLALVAALSLAIAVLDATAPTAPTAPASCASANRSLRAHQLSQAERSYSVILAVEPERHCARVGVELADRFECARGEVLLNHRAYTEAIAIFDEIFNREPSEDWPRLCALEGLALAGRLAPTALCSNTLKGPCIVNTINVEAKNGLNGLNGPPGKNGVNGKNGLNGTNGLNGLNGKNGENGSSGKNGLNGKNGANGASGPPGKNGLNGRNGQNGVSEIVGPDDDCDDWHPGKRCL
jgi:Collagen triple helix repeat (20 copies)